MQTLIYNAKLVLRASVLEDGWLLIEDTRIADIGEASTYPNPATIAAVLDARSAFLLPGLIDLHCDAIEKLVEPRPDVHFDLPMALAEADWRLAGCGITTEFHAVSLDDDEFGTRSDSFLPDLARAIRAQADTLLVRHRLHARLELSSSRGFRVLSSLLAARIAANGQRKSSPSEGGHNGDIDLVSLMDHSPGQGQYTTEQAYREYVMRTTNRSSVEIDAKLALRRSQVSAIADRIASIAGQVCEAGLALATHDDDTIAKVEQWPALGVTMSEFPTTQAAGRRAHELGLVVCMGAPNALRGKSSGGNLSAQVAIQAGILDALCSDYYPGALLFVPFKLAEQGLLALPQAMQLVTINPARAVGLDGDFGSLEPGKIADLALVRMTSQGIPLVERVFVGGKERVGRVDLR